MLVSQIEEIVEVIQDPFFFCEHISEHFVKYFVICPSSLWNVTVGFVLRSSLFLQMHCDFRLACQTDVDRASLEATETARHLTELWMSVITYVCVRYHLSLLHATHLHHIPPPPWPGAPVLDPRMFATQAGGENDEISLFD